jgi:hypothetical protein
VERFPSLGRRRGGTSPFYLCTLPLDRTCLPSSLTKELQRIRALDDVKSTNPGGHSPFGLPITCSNTFPYFLY